MMVNLEQVKNGVFNFIDREIGAKATGFKKFSIYFLAPTIRNKVVDYLITMKEFVPELFDENDNVDIDKLYNMGKDAIKKSGQFEFMGILFNESDIDRLYSIIKSNSI